MYFIQDTKTNKIFSNKPNKEWTEGLLQAIGTSKPTAIKNYTKLKEQGFSVKIIHVKRSVYYKKAREHNKLT